MVVLRELVGETLRAQRVRRGMTLRDVSAKARVSLGYISEVERGHKEPSSELLAALCEALEISLSRLLRDVSVQLELAEQLESMVPDDVSDVREPLHVG